MASHKSVESLHVSLLHALHDLEVGEQVLLEVFLVEDLAVGDLSHQELDNDEQFLSVDAEADCTDFWCLSQRLLKGSLSL